MNINTCAALAESLGLSAVALYSHLFPAVLAIFLGWYSAVTTRFTTRSVAFLFFTLAVALWLICDVILWTVPDYTLVAFFWSWIDFIDVIFFVLAAYFFATLARGGISQAERGFLLALCIPAFIFAVTGNATSGFDHTWCEMHNNENSVLYKSFAEWVSIIFILVSLALAWRQSDHSRRIALATVFVSLLLFLSTFSVTEYLAAQTAHYEINLYGLFALPVFLIAMVFAITNLEVFRIRHLSAQILVYVLILLVASQFLFLQSSTDAFLNGLTLAFAVIIGAILLQNEKQQLGALVEIEELAEQLSDANVRLRDLDQLKNQFLSFASHQLRSPLTAIKWQSQLLLDGTVGKLPNKAKETVVEIEESADHLVELVNEFLNLRKLQEGRMEYSYEPTDIAESVSHVVDGLQQLAEHKHLTLSFVNRATKSICAVDRQKFAQVIQNLVDNAIKYTDTGSVSVSVENEAGGLVNIAVSDTGHGIDPAVIDKLFEQFVRDKKDAVKIEGTGLGLYIAKQIMDAHHGRIWATSPGPGKGSTFFVQLKTISK